MNDVFLPMSDAALSRAETRWFNFENPTGARGAGGKRNRGAKGAAFAPLPPGKSLTLMNTEGAGEVRRFWLTVSDRRPEVLRGLRIDMTWDGAVRPAVSCPLGDFFGMGMGQMTAFESDSFSSPEGRSFLCTLPMPWRTAARVELRNESGIHLGHVFYEINALIYPEAREPTFYFHAWWNREQPNVLGEAFTILPPVEGRGRYLGANLGIRTSPAYEGHWWGEGEVEVRFGCDKNPTLVGTGVEDYAGTAWGQGRFSQRHCGSPVADKEAGVWCFYRHHLPDPVIFQDGCDVRVQTLGGAPLQEVRRLIDLGVELTPVSLAPEDPAIDFIPFLESDPPLDVQDPGLPEGWCNFYRRDDWSGTAYFYLDRPVSDLPSLPPVGERTRDLPDPVGLVDRLIH